jgi:hypothetical protein
MMDRYTVADVAPRMLLAVQAFDAAKTKTAASNGWQSKARAKKTA